MKTFQQFIKEAYIIIERRKYDDESHGFDRRLSKKEKEELELNYDTPSETKEGQRHARETNNPNPRHGFTLIRHKPSGITFEVTHKVPENKDPTVSRYPHSHLGGKNKDIHGHKPNHDVQWYHQDFNSKDLPSHEKYKIARNAARVWSKHISHRIPSGHLVSNQPDDNYDERRRNPEKNTRASAYRRYGFGELSSKTGKQYAAKIGDKLHPINQDK